MTDRSDRPRVLIILERLNTARASGNPALVAELEAELDQLDRRVGYGRGMPRVARHVAPVNFHTPPRRTAS